MAAVVAEMTAAGLSSCFFSVAETAGEAAAAANFFKPKGGLNGSLFL